MMTIVDNQQSIVNGQKSKIDNQSPYSKVDSQQSIVNSQQLIRDKNAYQKVQKSNSSKDSPKTRKLKFSRKAQRNPKSELNSWRVNDRMSKAQKDTSIYRDRNVKINSRQSNQHSQKPVVAKTTAAINKADRETKMAETNEKDN